MSSTPHAVVQLAIVDAARAERPVVRRTGHVARARSVLNRLLVRDHDVREALGTLMNAMGDLENELDEMRNRLALAHAGVDFGAELVELLPDGLRLQREVGMPPGAPVIVHIDLTVWNTRRLLSLAANVADDRRTLAWGDITEEERDVLVGFSFQEQSRERRRARDLDPV